MQLESAYHTNKKKRTADQAFRDDDYYDHLYGIVSNTKVRILFKIFIYAFIKYHI
jgi:hypothetical protein